MFDITSKAVNESARIELKDADGSPLLDDKGEQLAVTVYGPGSKVWQQATSEMNRKRAERMRKNGGKIEAALDNAKPDQVDFLVRCTISFDGWSYPGAEGPEMFRAAYADDRIGFIRDHVFGEVNDWGAFTKGSAPS